ncbi:MAG: EAL domain-containing protein [Azonexus sp.]|nr:EAL domain-containing protein [Azonexus sp.]MDZ4313402.1 EAL domain-containing protein [Azonexus sp.]
MALSLTPIFLFIVGFDLWVLNSRPELLSDGSALTDSSPVLAPGTLSVLVIGAIFALFALFSARWVWRVQRQTATQLCLQRNIFEHTAEAMLVTNGARQIVAVNPAFEQITGYCATDVLGCSPDMLSPGGDQQGSYIDAWAGVAERGAWQGEIWARRKDGEIYPTLIRLRSVCESEQHPPSHFVAMFSDISAQKAQETRIDYLAHHDPLTALPNRQALGVFLASQIAAAGASVGQTLALLIIDLDNFKTVNDSLGHHAGDQLLRQMAARLQLHLGPSAQLFRLGGDEFAIVQAHPAPAEAVVALAQEIFRAVGEPCEINTRQLHISPSLGISLYPADGDTAEMLIRNADTALYFAKANGRNNYQFFTEPMSAAANKRLSTESELWQALANDQLLLHYQPQINLVSGEVVGVEALVRWQHPQHGLIFPTDFIPVAEACSLILPLGNWVLLAACRQAKAWLDAGLDLGEIAVNISALQFCQPDFAMTVQRILLETGLPPERLELEITESTVMQSADSSVKVLAELKKMGIKLAIDDFGTGYSSLTYLRRFSVDRLKIDRSFVADLESDVDAASLVASIVSMGHTLGLELVAEGVENAVQADFLRDRHCQRVQGFHFSRPVSAEAVVGLSHIFRRSSQLV